MKSPHKLVAAASGVIMAFATAVLAKPWLEGSVRNVWVWAIFTIAWGAVSKTGAEAAKLGAVYGFVLGFCYLWFDKTGSLSPDKVIPLTALTLIVAGACAIGNVALAWVSYQAARLARRLFASQAKEHHETSKV